MQTVNSSAPVRVIGTSAERLAMPAEAVPPGALFHESDTGATYKYWGGWLDGENLRQDLIDNTHSGQPSRSFGFVAGRNTAVQNVRVDVWEGPTGTYVFPTTPQQMQVVSSSANDSASGTGAQRVTIHYLDGSYLEGVEVVTMNGTTPVQTKATNILRINGFHLSAAGSGGQAAGNISLTNLAGSVTYSYMAAGFNTARQAIYTVPGNKYGYISHWQASSGAASGTHFTQIALRATSHAGVLVRNFLMVDEVGTLNNGMAITLPTPIRIPPKADVKMSAVSDAANANAVAMGAIMGWFETA